MFRRGSGCRCRSGPVTQSGCRGRRAVYRTLELPGANPFKEAHATLPLNQSAVPLLDQVLGPAPSTKEVFETLDRQYREQHKPEFWFLPLNKPIAPHLDELLGPVPKTEKK